MYLTLEKLYEHVDGHFDEHLERIREYLRQPSISADGTGIMETVEITKGFIDEIGGHSEIVPTDGWPVVYGELFTGKDKKTLLITVCMMCSLLMKTSGRCLLLKLKL